MNNLKPVSRVLDTINVQIEEHKALQKEISSHREIMVSLDKTGTHLKYFSQKQDVILIKNLLASVTHRWEKVNIYKHHTLGILYLTLRRNYK